MTKPIIHIRKPRDWKNLHPAPRVAVEEKNCCDCIFWSGICGNQEGSERFCAVQSKQMNAYDECAAFTRKSNKPEKE